MPAAHPPAASPEPVEPGDGLTVAGGDQEIPEATADTAVPESHGKRVSFVELYLDLIFVLAVGRLSQLLVEEPTGHRVLVTLGLFLLLWWTWIGFVVLFNRYGVDDRWQRFAFLAATVPGGIAAVAVVPAADGDTAVLAGALAAIRFVLVIAHFDKGHVVDLARQRASAIYAVSGTMFAVSLLLPERARLILWGVIILSESGAILDDDLRRDELPEFERGQRRTREEVRQLRAHARDARRRARAHRKAEQRAQRGRGRDREQAGPEMLARFAPKDPKDGLDAHHFAERFGLFLIILLGEVVLEAGKGTLDHREILAQQWVSLGAAMVLAASLWWLYFSVAADINRQVLDLAGGSPAIARTIFAVGHMVPAFALLLISGGVGALIEHEGSTAAAPHLSGAYVLVSAGLALYLFGTRSFMFANSGPSGALRAAILVATVFLARLRHELAPNEYLLVVTVWALGCAALVIRDASYFGRRAARIAESEGV
ncbi:MAG: low temperature requirement protein A [Solirubrobacteraceae bacterium]|nr:low temperature requirement protein A [Solirubrobacteraceae bacterium]